MPTTDERCAELREVVENAVLGLVPGGWDDEADGPTWRTGSQRERLESADDAVDELHHMVRELAVHSRAMERVMAAHRCMVGRDVPLAEYLDAVGAELSAWPDTYLAGAELGEWGEAGEWDEA